MHILILGAGYAGLRTALDLDRLLREQGGNHQVTLVDQNPYHQVIQLLHLTATESIPAHEVAIDLDHILRRRMVRFKQGRAEAIDPLKRHVRLSGGEVLDYDRLIIALGAETNYHDVPGALEHTLPLHTYDHAMGLSKHIRERFTTAASTSDPRQLRILLTFAIVGGGYTGCQLAGELAVWVRELADEYGVPRSELRIALLEVSNALLKQFGSWATREAERVLDSRGVSVYLSTAVERVEPGALYVQGGRVLRAGTIVWAGGIQGPPLLAAAGLPVDEFGRVLVDRYLRVADQALIFACGDCAHVPDFRDGPVPATASYAMRQGEHLAEAIMAEVEGRAPRAYEPLRLGELVSLGPGEGVGDPLGLPITGRPVMMLKKGIEAYYRATLE